MFKDSENLKDTAQSNTSVPVLYKKKNSFLDAYPKLEKLITALYMVTDIIDKNEPIRLKLRTLGVEILSDISLTREGEIKDKIQTILSFLDIALAIGLVSEMNFNILKKEFTELSKALESQKIENEVSTAWLEEFLATKNTLPTKENLHTEKRINSPKNIQNNRNLNTISLIAKNDSFPNIVKKQRREDILKAIKENGGSATISEVKNKADGDLVNCGEKTLQRELVSMVKGGILDKVGSKRWSKYFLKN